MLPHGGMVTRPSVRIDSYVHLLVIVLVIVSWWQLTSTKQQQKMASRLWVYLSALGLLLHAVSAAPSLLADNHAKQLLINQGNNFQLIRCFD
jgi:hypothetical protein